MGRVQSGKKTRCGVNKMKIVNPRGPQSATQQFDTVLGRTIYIENTSLVTTITIAMGRGGEVDTYPLGPSTATFTSFIEFEDYDTDTIQLLPTAPAITFEYIVIIKDNPMFDAIRELVQLIKDLPNHLSEKRRR